MTREHAQAIIGNIETVKHLANGGKVYYPIIRCDGTLIEWKECDRMLLNCIKNYHITPMPITQPSTCECPVCGSLVKEE